jgi:putative hydrolase of the HAD superfamily
MIRAIFFDLDNTLYDQDLYFLSAYTTIARYLEKCFSFPNDYILSILMVLLREKGSMYSTLFDDLLESIGSREENLVRVLVELFHNAAVETLVPYEDAGIVLPRLARTFSLGIITNGYAEMQRRKVAALGLSELLPIQVYTAELCHPKPSKRCYEHAIKMVNVNPGDSLYVGDNPYIDFMGAKETGMYTVRLMRGEFMTVQSIGESVDAQVKDYYELEDLISNLNIDSTWRHP